MDNTRSTTRIKRSRWLARAIVAVAFSAFLLACETDHNAALEDDGRGGGAPAAARPPPPPAAPAAAGAAADGAAQPLAAIAYKDEDFVESLRNRDPFRSYTIEFRAKVSEDVQRRVIMPATAIEEMALIAIVTGMPRPKAMLVDTAGVGHVVERGDYIGRPRLIQAAGSVSMALNWRVDRIRDNEVVLTQQDPTDPTRSSLTKIIPLRAPGEADK
jgi:type IV pilus assembly protein PilP